MVYHWRNNDVSVFVCRMGIEGKTYKYDNFLRLSRKRLLVLGCKIRSNVLKYVKNEEDNCKNVLYFDCYWNIFHNFAQLHGDTYVFTQKNIWRRITRQIITISLLFILFVLSVKTLLWCVLFHKETRRIPIAPIYHSGGVVLGDYFIFRVNMANFHCFYHRQRGMSAPLWFWRNTNSADTNLIIKPIKWKKFYFYYHVS